MPCAALGQRHTVSVDDGILAVHSVNVLQIHKAALVYAE